MSKSGIQHSMCLDHLIYNLEEIRESTHKAKWVMKEGVWFRNNSKELEVFPDLIVVYADYAVPIDAKRSKVGRSHGIDQLYKGFNFIEDELKLVAPYGKLVYYGSGLYYKHEVIPR